MPAIRSRMSSSSSTIRMSRAISGLLDRHHRRLLLALGLGFWRILGRFGFWLGGWFGIRRAQWQREGKAGADASIFVGIGVDQLDRPAMLFDDAGDDGKAEAGPLLTRRDVGLEQALTVFLRPALAVVGDRDPRLVGFCSELNVDDRILDRLEARAFDGRDRVFDQVG